MTVHSRQMRQTSSGTIRAEEAGKDGGGEGMLVEGHEAGGCRPA